MLPGLPKIAARCRLHTVADRYADMLHDRIVAIAIDHASSAAVAYALSSVEVANVAERPVPIVAAPKLQVPIQIEIFPAAEASEPFRLTAAAAGGDQTCLTSRTAREVSWRPRHRTR